MRNRSVRLKGRRSWFEGRETIVLLWDPIRLLHLLWLVSGFVQKEMRFVDDLRTRHILISLLHLTIGPMSMVFCDFSVPYRVGGMPSTGEVTIAHTSTVELPSDVFRYSVTAASSSREAEPISCLPSSPKSSFRTMLPRPSMILLVGVNLTTGSWRLIIRRPPVSPRYPLTWTSFFSIWLRDLMNCPCVRIHSE